MTTAVVRVPKHSCSKPKAHSNYVMLGEAQLAYIAEGSGTKQVGDDKVATLLRTTIEIPQNRYLCTYTSNETKNAHQGFKCNTIYTYKIV